MWDAADDRQPRFDAIIGRPSDAGAAVVGKPEAGRVRVRLDRSGLPEPLASALAAELEELANAAAAQTAPSMGRRPPYEVSISTRGLSLPLDVRDELAAGVRAHIRDRLGAVEFTDESNAPDGSDGDPWSA